MFTATSSRGILPLRELHLYRHVRAVRHGEIGAILVLRLTSSWDPSQNIEPAGISQAAPMRSHDHRGLLRSSMGRQGADLVGIRKAAVTDNTAPSRLSTRPRHEIAKTPERANQELAASLAAGMSAQGHSRRF
jgi:hypothetical protein